MKTKQELLELLNSLSLEDKIGQLQQVSPVTIEATGLETGVPTQNNGEIKKNFTSVLNLFGAEKLMKIQDEYLKNNEHKIPMLFMADIIHGYRTIMPIPLAQGCSFNPALVEKCNSNVAAEASADGMHVTFAPMVDLARDPRWGRILESTGEDTYLNTLFSAAMVRGFQGEDLSKDGTIAATVKHFAAYGGAEGGRDYNTVDISERSLRQDYLPSYKAGVDAGVALIMTSFNVIGGVPSTGNKKLLRDILRDEWGFNGTIITDWGSANTMISHSVAANQKEAARLSIEAGVDIEMCTPCYDRHLKELIDEGTVDIKLVDESVMRVLELKNKLGLFDNPYRFANPEKAKQIIGCDEFLADAKELACQSSVLLKNEDNILPLSEKSGKIAFIGPYTCEKRLNGAWSVLDKNENSPTLEQTLKKRFGDKAFKFAEGSKLLGVEQYYQAEFLKYDMCEDTREAKMKEAVKLAKKVDTVVMCIGEHYFESGEARGKAHITLPDVQIELFNRIYAVNKNIVVVLFNGRPVEIKNIADKAKAVLDVWFGGTMATEAIADMLFGITAPSGRLSASFPLCVGQIPVYYNYLPTDHPVENSFEFGSRHIDIPSEPCYPFGYGLSYTTFEYSDFTLSSDTLTKDGSITATVKVKNTGNRDSFETVQLYIRDRFASVSRPVKELKGFKKVWIKAGEEVSVDITLTPDDLRIYDINMDYVTEPGDFYVFVGKDSTVKEYKVFKYLG